MLCEKCHKREANVFYTQIVNGVKTEKHLCSGCAGREGLVSDSFSMFNPWKEDFLDHLINMDESRGYPENRCQCGTSYEKFAGSGLLGCPECYDTFRFRLNPLLDRIHGSHTHTGRFPGLSGAEKKEETPIQALRRKLDENVKKENYEEAARIRDQIRDIENKGKSDNHD